MTAFDASFNPPWVPLATFGIGNWTDYGGGWQTAQIKREGSRIYIRGLLLRTVNQAPASDVITRIPAEYCPTGGNVSVTTYANVAGVGEAEMKLNIYPYSDGPPAGGAIQQSRPVDPGGYIFMDGSWSID